LSRRRALVSPAPGTAAPSGRLTGEALDALLCYLDGDREQAGERYLALRRRLARFFECRGCTVPEELADETLDRMAKRLLEGQQVHAAAPGAYAHGFAKNVLREWWRTRRPDPPLGGPERFAAPPPAVDTAAARRERSLEACLTALPEAERHLILKYYQGDEAVLIGPRRELAERLGIGMNALRIRAHRIRTRLEECVRARLAAAEIESAPRSRDDEDDTGW
jgi:DNA-directed RNA polymerase specialized sigma24 family protein